MSAAFISQSGMGRAFSPHGIITAMNLGRWPRLVWQRAFGPESPRASDETARCRFRAKGATPYQPGATPQVPIPGGGGRMSAAFISQSGMGRAFSPHGIITAMDLGRWPRLVWQRAFGPESRRASDETARCRFRADGASEAPKAQPHTSLGQRPRIAAPNRMRAESPPHLAAPCLNRYPIF